MADGIGSVDPSIYQPRGGAANPLGMMGSMVDIMGGLQRNMLAGQELASRQAIPQLMQQSIDPATGQVDHDKFALSMSSDPRTAWMAPDYLARMNQAGLIDIQRVRAKMEYERDRLAMFAQAATPFAREIEANNGVFPGDPSDPSRPALGRLATALAGLAGRDPDMLDGLADFYAQLGTMDRGQLGTYIPQLAQGLAAAQGHLSDVLTQMDKVDPATGQPVHGFVSRYSGIWQPAMEQTGGGGGGAPLAPLGGAGGASPHEFYPGGPTSPAVINGAPGAQTQEVSPRSYAPVAAGLGPVGTSTMENVSRYEADLGPRTGQATQTRQILHQLADIPDVTNLISEAGPGTALRAQLESWASFLNADPAEVNRYFNLGDMVALKKYLFQLGAGQAANLFRHFGARGGTQMEWLQTQAKGSPETEMPPSAIIRLLNATDQAARWTQQEYASYYDLKTKVGRHETNPDTGRPYDIYDLGQYEGVLWPQILGGIMDKESAAERAAREKNQ